MALRVTQVAVAEYVDVNGVPRVTATKNEQINPDSASELRLDAVEALAPVSATPATAAATARTIDDEYRSWRRGTAGEPTWLAAAVRKRKGG